MLRANAAGADVRGPKSEGLTDRKAALNNLFGVLIHVLLNSKKNEIVV